MRTMTKINWVRSKVTDHLGHLRATFHTGARGGWKFRIETVPGWDPKLTAWHEDGRQVSSGHDSLNRAKDAALSLLHPSEGMGWVSTSGTVKYRAQWDDFGFAVYTNPEGPGLVFAWRDSRSDVVKSSEPVPVSGVKEARQLAASVLRGAYPAESPAVPAQTAGDPVEALDRALCKVGIGATDDQIRLLAAELGLV